MREEPVSLLDQSVPVQKLLIRLVLIPMWRSNGRHAVTTVGPRLAPVSAAKASVRAVSDGQETETWLEQQIKRPQWPPALCVCVWGGGGDPAAGNSDSSLANVYRAERPLVLESELLLAQC